MGDPRKTKKHYSRPKKRWDRGRIEEERKLMETYGLKNKREIRRFETVLRGKRQQARKMLAMPATKREKFEKQLMKSLERMALLKVGSTLDDVLSLSLPSLLERRLQTIVWRKNLASTIKQARQFITHGHIAIHGIKVDKPNYLVRAGEEEHATYFKQPMKIGEQKPARKTEITSRAAKIAGAEKLTAPVGGELAGVMKKQ